MYLWQTKMHSKYVHAMHGTRVLCDSNYHIRNQTKPILLVFPVFCTVLLCRCLDLIRSFDL